jgi:hypothetical protein
MARSRDPGSETARTIDTGSVPNVIATTTAIARMVVEIATTPYGRGRGREGVVLVVSVIRRSVTVVRQSGVAFVENAEACERELVVDVLDRP